MFLYTAGILISFLVSSSFPSVLLSGWSAAASLWHPQPVIVKHNSSLFLKSHKLSLFSASNLLSHLKYLSQFNNCWVITSQTFSHCTEHTLDMPKQSNVSPASIPICFTLQIMKVAPISKYQTLKKTHKDVNGHVLLKLLWDRLVVNRSWSHLTQTTG